MAAATSARRSTAQKEVAVGEDMGSGFGTGMETSSGMGQERLRAPRSGGEIIKLREGGKMFVSFEGLRSVARVAA
jgi:hypothetical protein